jgi:hypothetical protein
MQAAVVAVHTSQTVVVESVALVAVEVEVQTLLLAVLVVLAELTLDKLELHPITQQQTTYLQVETQELTQVLAVAVEDTKLQYLVLAVQEL